MLIEESNLGKLSLWEIAVFSLAVVVSAMLVYLAIRMVFRGLHKLHEKYAWVPDSPSWGLDI